MAGDSAGGNLAAALTLMARDRIGPMPVFQLLIYPVFDHARDMASPTTTLRCPHRARPSHNRPPHAASPDASPLSHPRQPPRPGAASMRRAGGCEAGQPAYVAGVFPGDQSRAMPQPDRATPRNQA